jgi:long-chain acyl-CoA synthetase
MRAGPPALTVTIWPPIRANCRSGRGLPRPHGPEVRVPPTALASRMKVSWCTVSQSGSAKGGEVMNTCDFLLERGSPTDVAIIEGSRRWTYAQLRDGAAVLASHLRDTGLTRGAPVVVAGGNSFFWVAAYLAILKLGLVAVPAGADLRRLPERMAWLGCRTIMVDRRDRRRLDLDPDLTVITEEDIADGAPGYWPDGRIGEHDDAALMFTSGSTADPKAVRVTHANVQANTESINAYLHLSSSDRMLVVLPFFYCFGASLLHTHLRAGGSIVLCNTFAFPETAVTAMADNACTGLAGVPSTFAILLRRSTFGQRPLPHLRRIQQAGGRLANPLIEQLERCQPQAEVFVMYGQTEATARLSYLPPVRLHDKLGSIGRGIPGVELQVRGSDGLPVAAGGQGEIWAHGANVSPGYYRNPAATRDKFQDGWLRTGDLGRVDDEGFIYVIDRKDDFIKSWGHRVSALEVEEGALAMPDVVNAAVVGAPDDMAGELIVLFAEMTGDDPAREERLRKHLEATLPRHLVPDGIHLVPRLPLNANGKVDRRALRQAVAVPVHSPTGGET